MGHHLCWTGYQDVDWGWEHDPIRAILWTCHHLRWMGAHDADWGQGCWFVLARQASSPSPFVFFVATLKDSVEVALA